MTPEMLERPTQESVICTLGHLSEFAFDMDVQALKGHTSQVIHHPEIFNEAMDLVSIFGLCRQLACINGIEDFCLRDVWEPQTKRLRLLLSGIINFCRYKESQFIIISGLKEDVQSLEGIRLEREEKVADLDHELADAQVQHEQEQPKMWACEHEVQDAREEVERLGKQRHQVERQLEELNSDLEADKKQADEEAWRLEHLRTEVDQLRGRVADSPEGLEEEIRELQHSIKQQKSRLQEKVDEKGHRSQRVQVLARLVGHLERYGEEFACIGAASAQVAQAQARGRAAEEEHKNLCQTLEARRCDEAELGQSLKQVNTDIDRFKEQHEERVQDLENRRQLALQQHQEAQARRSEEQRKAHALNTQRLELESEVARQRRAHEQEMADARARHRALLDDAENYVHSLEALMQPDDALPQAVPQASPIPSATKYRSPYPRRLSGCSPMPAMSPLIGVLDYRL